MNKILIPVISLAAVGGLAFGIVQMNGAGDMRDQLGKLNDELALQKKALSDALAGMNSTRDEMQALKEKNNFLSDELGKAKREAKEAAANAAADAGIANAPADTPEKRGEEAIKNLALAFDRGLNTPEARNAMRSNQTRMISRAYDGLYKKLNLSPEDQKVVSELISDRNTAAFDKARKLFGGKNDDATIAAARDDILSTKADFDTKLRGVVGEQKFNEIKTYEQTIGEQRSVDSFARSMERKGTPLESTKKDALLSAMQAERLKIAGNDIPDIGGGPGMAVMLTEAEAKAKQLQEEQYEVQVLAQARQIGLTPDEINELQDNFKQQKDQKAIGSAIGRAFLGGGLDKLIPPRK